MGTYSLSRRRVEPKQNYSVLICSYYIDDIIVYLAFIHKPNMENICFGGYHPVIHNSPALVTDASNTCNLEFSFKPDEKL